jgi:hypothetical protein
MYVYINSRIIFIHHEWFLSKTVMTLKIALAQKTFHPCQTVIPLAHYLYAFINTRIIPPNNMNQTARKTFQLHQFQ